MNELLAANESSATTKEPLFGRVGTNVARSEAPPSEGGGISDCQAPSSRSRAQLIGYTQFFEHLGKRVSIRQLSLKHGLPMMTLYQRWHRGDRGERLVRPAARRYVHGG